jgi:hypothetical protein
VKNPGQKRLWRKYRGTGGDAVHFSFSRTHPWPSHDEISLHRRSGSLNPDHPPIFYITTFLLVREEEL